MKFLAAAATLALATVASAQIQITDPTKGSVWKVETPNYIGWTGTCASMGAAAKAVDVEVVNGPADAVKYVVTIGTLDCSTTSNTSVKLSVPKETSSGPFESGLYSLRIKTIPEQYSPQFTINNPAAPPPSTTGPATTTTSAPPKPTDNAANILAAGSALAMAGVAAFQFLL
ncbi:hypothetical protein BGX29_008330 [Mortierella sp. GBA35]|nr:hypothetical protein BGX23_000255 [Mortierella sp. AD031]KAF9097011.1 hypothetical protein BGX29_008330 [Mortierella sp. GBA35]KAG0212686.1 hypothetical protein BGX33_003402 [Mortierella sp. NVP41]